MIIRKTNNRDDDIDLGSAKKGVRDFHRNRTATARKRWGKGAKAIREWKASQRYKMGQQAVESWVAECKKKRGLTKGIKKYKISIVKFDKKV